MSYEKTTWQTGDVITANKLNNIENGIAGILVTEVEIDGGDASLSNTWQEIHDATLCLIRMPSEVHDSYPFLPIVSSTEGEYKVTIIMNASPIEFVANSPDGYPNAVSADDPIMG